MKISMSSKKKTKPVKVKPIKVKTDKTVKTKVAKSKTLKTKNIKTFDKKKLFLGLGIGGGIVLVAGIVLLLVLFFNPALIVSGRVFEDETKTSGLSFCEIYEGSEKIATTNGLGEFSLSGLEVGDEITFIHADYNLNDFSQYDYVVTGRAYIEIIGSLKPTSEQLQAQEGITLNFLDANNNLITNTITAKDVNNNTLASTSSGQMIIKIESNIAVHFDCYYYIFANISLTLDDKNTVDNLIGTFNAPNERNYLTCQYALMFEDNTAFVNNSATVIYTYTNNLTNETFFNTLNYDPDEMYPYVIQFSSANKVMFDSMTIFIKDERNQRYWYVNKVYPSPSSGTVDIKIKSGYLAVANYIPGRKIYLENGGMLNCDSAGNFWFVANGAVPKFYSSKEKTTELKLYNEENLISTINSNNIDLCLR